MSAQEDKNPLSRHMSEEYKKQTEIDTSAYVPLRVQVVDDEAVGEIKVHTKSTAPATEQPQSEEAFNTMNDSEKNTTQAENFGYIIPREPYKKVIKQKHKAARRKDTKAPTKKEMRDADAGYVFASPKRRRKQKGRRYQPGHRRRGFKALALWKRILLIILIVLLALIIALAGTFLILNEMGRNSMHDYDNLGVIPPTQDESGNGIIPVDKSGRVITYDGVSYEFNEDLITVVFIGVDEGEDGNNTHLQMADAIYILTLDTKSGKVKLLGISRDTMADVDLYSEQGEYIDTRRLQMAYSYAYESEEVTGGKNTTNTLSRLFYGLPFDNYFAINMNALIALNDTIGGVTLTSSITFTSPVDGRTIYEGETVTLHGKEADHYVRTRDIEQLDSNNDRMKRQQEYIRAFVSSILPAVKQDISVVSKLYDEIRSNSDTTLDIPKMTYIASTAVTKLSSASDIEYISLKGDITAGEHAEMNIKNEDAIRTMLDVFYKPLARIPDSIAKK